MRRRAETELLDAVPHLVAIEPEELGRVRLVAAGPFQCLHQQLALDVVETDASWRQAELRDCVCVTTEHRQILDGEVSVRLGVLED